MKGSSQKKLGARNNKFFDGPENTLVIKINGTKLTS